MPARRADRAEFDVIVDPSCEMSEDRAGPSGENRWVAVAAFFLSLMGVGASTYMTIAHFTEASILACSGGGELSCTVVTTSAQSRIVGIPVAVIGLGFFVAMSVLTAPPVWRRGGRVVALTRSTLLVAGFVFVLWLVAAEIVIIGHVCLWCTAVHVITVALVLVMTRASSSQLGLSTVDRHGRPSRA